ncbi:MAG: TetR-like C-terminal domain-containing protein, partial [Alphaproteobacteria bacterium]
EVFTHTMIDEKTAKGGGPHADLLAICHGYLRFAREHQAQFRLMFSSEGLDFNNPELEHQSSAAYQVLRQGCAPFSSSNASSQDTEIMIWSLVHGYAEIAHRAREKQGEHPARKTDFVDILSALDLKIPGTES